LKAEIPASILKWCVSGIYRDLKLLSRRWYSVCHLRKFLQVYILFYCSLNY